MIYIVNGPNLNLLGRREPEKYGTTTLSAINADLERIAAAYNEKLEFFQSNSEGAIIDYLQSLSQKSRIILNPGALAHTSIALRDCITAIEGEVVEVHLTNIYAREEFRHFSYVSAVAKGVISGLGSEVYSLALRWFLEKRVKQ